MSVFLRSASASLAAFLVVFLSNIAWAQSKDDHAAPSLDPPTPPAVAPASADTALPGDAQIAAALSEGKLELARQKKALEDAQTTLSDLQRKVDTTAVFADQSDWASRFKIYGFTDVGVNRVWVKDRGLFATGNSSNATSFVVGDLDLYFDAQPIKGWRSLVEIRFTNAPQGEVQNYGGLAGTFKRTSTMETDPNAATFFANQWGASLVIERAYLEWTDLSYLKLRVGNYFTPFGIWNVDHGAPTLIATQMPGMITQRMFPLRQTGIEAYGNTFKGDWELGYHATVSNGRQELSNFAFDDNRGFGGRLYANNEKGESTVKVGASFYTGRVRDQEIDITSISPVTFSKKSTFDYREIVGGVDLSIDVGRTRIRTEGAVRSVQYDDGKHELAQTISATPRYSANGVLWNGYFLIAHTLPWIPVELYSSVDVTFGAPFTVGDTAVGPGVGVNVRFNKSILWKTQVVDTLLYDTRGRTSKNDLSDLTAVAAFSRLVLVF